MSSFDPKQLDKFPQESGVYLMKNDEREVIYVGKAKNLKKRIKQYFVPGRDERPMVPFLTAEIASIDTIVVPNEKEALLLENTLIKRHQPKYNAILKDDKTFISLMINHKHPWPMIKLIRYKGKPKKDGLYFGPYTSAFAARQTFELLTRVFPLRQCSDEELKRRTRPCILYGIKRCIAPCVKQCTKEEYQTFVDGAIDFLKGNDKKLLKELYAEMVKASDGLEYEKAAALLKTIRQIEHVTEGGGLVARPGGQECDVFGIFRQGDEVMLAQLIFREGKLIGSEHYNFSEIAQTDEELLSSFLIQFYKDHKQIPKEILVPFRLSDAVGNIVSADIVLPQKGEKKALVDMAYKNAKALFAQEKDQLALKEKMLLDLQDKLKLNRYPERIECFDTSNISGADLVASMVAFTDGEYDRKRTRLYKIRTVQKGDDYAALTEVVTRRLIRAKEENDLPDLIIIDGGKGQLGIALKVMKELDIATVDAIGIAKQEARHDKGMTLERIFLPHESEPVKLDSRSPLLFLLQKIRDAAHEKAIGFHRKRRSQRTLTSSLDTIRGIGPVKRKRLLHHFGSLKRIKDASDAELLQVKGITKKDILSIRNQT